MEGSPKLSVTISGGEGGRELGVGQEDEGGRLKGRRPGQEEQGRRVGGRRAEEGRSKRNEGMGGASGGSTHREQGRHMLLVVQLAAAAEVGEHHSCCRPAHRILQPLLELCDQEVQRILADCCSYLQADSCHHIQTGMRRHQDQVLACIYLTPEAAGAGSSMRQRLKKCVYSANIHAAAQQA